MLLCTLIAEAIFWSPAIICGVLALTVSPWFWTALGAIVAFWAAPLTPAIPLQIALIYLVKKIKERKDHDHS